MSETANSNILYRLAIWFVVLAAILISSCFKNAENRSDRDQQLAWRDHLTVLQAESAAEAERLESWLGSLDSRPDAKQQIEKELTGGDPLQIEKDGSNDVAHWTHPKYGTQVKLTFSETKLVGRRISYGTGQLQLVNPQPPRHSLNSDAESIRRRIIWPTSVLWFLALAVALVSNRFGRIAAEFMLAASLTCGAAWLVNPAYSITLQGVFSNDSLAFALMMYLASITVLAVRTPSNHAKFRLTLRTLLAVTAIVALLMATKPVGYIAIPVLGIGAILFLSILHSRATSQRP